MNVSIRPGLLLALTSALSSPAWAQPVMESFDRFEMNWSNMRMRYYGESATAANLEAAEKEATDQGLLYALNNIPKIRGEKGVPVDNAGDIAHAVSKQSYVYNTIYFSNGKVRVELDSSLAVALDPGRQPYAASETMSDGAAASGVQLEVKGLSEPQLINAIYDTSGTMVYSSADVTSEAYRKQLTGRWFYRASPELRNFAGAEPAVLEANFTNGRLVVAKDAWDTVRRNNGRLLSEAKVAFVIPKP